MVNDNNGGAVASESATQTTTASKPKKRNTKRKQNYAHLHKDALPLDVYTLPVFHPTHPLSLLQLVWTCLKQLAYPPSSHPAQKYLGYLSTESRSVHITDPAHVRALWERGFFGKGTLSRSEPSWMDRENARLAARSQGGQTAEEVTKARREERRLFKLERARLERERIERQRLIEQGKLVADVPSEGDALLENTADNQPPVTASDANLAGNENTKIGDPFEPLPDDDLVLQEPDIENQEHLQLTLEEAFFLKYALGVLDVCTADNATLTDSRALFDVFRRTSKFDASATGMDDQFILNYVVYHHFRSLGWVIRPGVKFSVDYLLYNRGPVFSHAEFAILIMPSYSDAYWSTSEGQSKKKLQDQRDWWWLHCINRVQSQVKKTLVLCYVDIPPPSASDEQATVKALLSRYKVREFIVRRWLMNRSRD